MLSESVKIKNREIPTPHLLEWLLFKTRMENSKGWKGHSEIKTLMNASWERKMVWPL